MIKLLSTAVYDLASLLTKTRVPNMPYFMSNLSFGVLQPQTFTLTNLSGVRRRQDLGQNGVEDMTQLSYVFILKSQVKFLLFFSIFVFFKIYFSNFCVLGT